VLLGEDACKGKRREIAVVDEDLSEQPAGLRLFGECLLELFLGQQLFGDQKLAELPPGKVNCRSLHAPCIGRKG
jgi:hypothetical protein